MQIYIAKNNPIDERLKSDLKNIVGRATNGVKEGLKEVWKENGAIGAVTAAESGIKGAKNGYKELQRVEVTLKSGYTMQGIKEAGLEGAAK